MPRDPEFDELTKEWRASVSKRLDDQYDKLDEYRNALTQLMLTASTNLALGELEKRVRELEKFQTKVLTVIGLTQLLLGCIWALLVKFVFK